mmetsp:Transcript_30444/g.86052  ORF Transcript_30444/g.86052 Transcript_30444/m.86052 type:complete len:443 (+) Transcript_30444:426-1754(+)
MGESSTCGCSCANLLSDLLDRVAKLESAIGAAGGPLGSGKGEPTQPPQSDSQAGKVGETAPGPQTVEVPKDVSLSSTKMLLQQMCLPRDCDGLGRCFGGIVLSWIDLAAAYSAVRVAGGPVVTASVDAVYFLRPLTVNTIAVLEATVNCTFSSSMEVGVRVFEENPSSGERVETCSAFLTFVSLNSLKRAGNPHPQPLPRLVAEGAKQEELMASATRRRQQRLAKRRAAAAKEPTSLPATDYRRTISVPDTSVIRSESRADPLSRMKISPDRTLSHLVQVVMPQHVNPGGVTFGGQVLSWVEAAAYLSAVRLNLTGHMLTANMDAVSFKESTSVGDILYFTSQVTAVFNSSVEVLVSVFAEQMNGGSNTEEKFVMDAFVTLVSVDDSGKPQPMQVTLDPSCDMEARRMEVGAAGILNYFSTCGCFCLLFCIYLEWLFRTRNL